MKIYYQLIFLPVATVMEIMYLTVLHKPYFNVEEEIIWGWVGETVNLNCVVEANPAANFTWKYVMPY